MWNLRFCGGADFLDCELCEMSREAFWESSRMEELLGVWKTSFDLVLLAAFWVLWQVLFCGKCCACSNNKTLAKSLAGEDRQAWR